MYLNVFNFIIIYFEILFKPNFIFSGSRATVTYRFGYVALDILNVIKADAGVYTCRAANAIGQAETSANLRISGNYLFYY